MRILLNRFKLLTIAMFLLAFCGNVNAQTYTITGNVNASALSCGTFSGNNVISVGNGSTATNLKMNANLDLTCLGAVQVVVRNNATIDFSDGNYDLRLALGSAVLLEPGATLNSGTNCSASDRIYINGSVVANCVGSGSTPSFVEVIANGGINAAGILRGNQYICTSGTRTTTFTATGTTGGTWTSNNASVATVNSSTGLVTAVSVGTAIITYTVSGVSASRSVYVNNSISAASSSPTLCVNTLMTNITHTTSGITGIGTPSNLPSGITAFFASNTITISGIPTVSGTFNYSIPLIGASCGVTNATGTITVRTIVNNVTDGFSSSSFCAGEQATITFNANNLSGVYPYTLVYRNDTTNATASVIIANDDATAFNVVPNPTATTDYTLLSITDSNGCVRTSGFGDFIARVTINALPNAPTVGTITHPTCAVATGSVVLSGLPSGNWTINPGAIPGNTTSTTISGLATGTYNFTVTNASGCTSLASSNVVINAQPFTPVQPTLGTITQPTCSVSTGSVTITNYNPGYIYTVSPSTGVTVSGSTISAPVGSYTVTATLGSCISIASSSFAILPLVIKTWNGAWSPVGTPTSNHIVIIDANYNTSSNGDLNACSLTVNTGSTLTINEGKFVIIQNDLTVNGTLEVLDKGSLVMVEDTGIVTNNGTTNIHRFTTPFKKYDYTYWSTPVVSTNIASTFSEWNTGYSYEYIPANFSDANADGLDDDGNDWSFASTMTPGNGYIIMVPTPVGGPTTNNPSEVVFSGKVNNGIQKITNVIPNSSYLLGNPYPSALDADTFLNYNAGVLDGTLYFWTHNTAIQAANSSNTSLGTGAFAFTSDDYASYNIVGGVGVGSAPTSGGTIPTGKIGSGQGFFASSNASIAGANEIVFNNAMRLGSGGTTLDNSQFFKTRNPKEKTANPIQKNRIWLNLTNAQGAFKQTLIGYVTKATNDYDSRFDGVSYDGNEFVDFYSVNQDKNLVIQGRALPFDENDEVPLGFRTTINGTFSINIEQVDGLLANQQVFIEDKLTNTISDLKSGNYTFTTAVGTFNERFVLRYKNNTSNKTLSVDETTEDKDGIIVLYSNNYKTLIIRNNGDSTINSVSLFSMTGQNISVWDVKDKEQTSIQIPIKDVSPGIYIVKVKTIMGESSKKIIIR